MKENIDAFKNKARHDILAASSTLEKYPDHTDIITFHCQQAVEKYFKAYLTLKNIKVKSKSRSC
jgi:HEPN domain-containing protein